MAENETKKISVELSAEIAKFTAAMASASKAVLSAAGIVAKETDSMAASVAKVGGATKKETNAIVAGLQQQAKVAKATAVIFSAAEKQRKDSATANIANSKAEAAATVAAIKQQQLALAKIRTERAGKPRDDGGIGGIAATLGTGAVAGAAGASLFNFAQVASDLEKTDFLLGRVFKGRKQEVVDFGDTISQSIGLSTLEAQGSLAKFGSQLSNALGDLGPATEYSKRLLAVAADISAAQNVDFTDTVQRLQSGIRGETEAIENLNIFVGANQLNPLALTEFGTSFAKLNEAQKTVVRLKGIFQQTTPIIGTAAAQVNTFQSSFNRLEGSLQNLKIALGQELISGFASLFQIVTGSIKAFIAYSNAGSGLLAKLAVLTIGIAGLSAAFISAVAAVQFFTPAIAGVGLTLFGVNSAIQAVLLSVGYLSLGIGALVAGFSLGALVLNMVGLGDSVDKVFESVTKLGDAFNNLFSGQSGKARDFADAQGKIADRTQSIVEQIDSLRSSASDLEKFDASGNALGFESTNEDLIKITGQIQDLEAELRNLRSQSSSQSLVPETEFTKIAIDSITQKLADFKEKASSEFGGIDSIKEFNRELGRVKEELKKAIATAGVGQVVFDKLFKASGINAAEAIVAIREAKIEADRLAEEARKKFIADKAAFKKDLGNLAQEAGVELTLSLGGGDFKELDTVFLNALKKTKEIADNIGKFRLGGDAKSSLLDVTKQAGLGLAGVASGDISNAQTNNSVDIVIARLTNQLTELFIGAGLTADAAKTQAGVILETVDVQGQALDQSRVIFANTQKLANGVASANLAPEFQAVGAASAAYAEELRSIELQDLPVELGDLARKLAGINFEQAAGAGFSSSLSGVSDKFAAGLLSAAGANKLAEQEARELSAALQAAGLEVPDLTQELGKFKQEIELANREKFSKILSDFVDAVSSTASSLADTVSSALTSKPSSQASTASGGRLAAGQESNFSVQTTEVDTSAIGAGIGAAAGAGIGAAILAAGAAFGVPIPPQIISVISFVVSKLGEIIGAILGNAEAIQNIFPLIADLGLRLGEAIGGSLIPIAEAFTSALNAAQGPVLAFGSILKSVFQTIGILKPVIEAASDAFRFFFDPIAVALSNLTNAAATASPILEALQPAFFELFKILFYGSPALLAFFIGIQVMEALIPVIQATEKAVSGLFGVFNTLFNVVMQFSIGFINPINLLFASIILVATVFGKFAEGIVALLGFIGAKITFVIASLIFNIADTFSALFTDDQIDAFRQARNDSAALASESAKNLADVFEVLTNDNFYRRVGGDFADGLAGNFGELSNLLPRVTEEFGKMSDALINLPSSINIAEQRYLAGLQASRDAVSPGNTVAPRQGGGLNPNASLAPQNIFNVDRIDLYANNPAQFAMETQQLATSEIRRRAQFSRIS